LKHIGEEALLLSPIASFRIPKSVEVVRKDCFLGCDCEVIFEPGSQLKELWHGATGYMDCVLPRFFDVPDGAKYVYNP
jgi:hypothetical protein